MELFCTFVACHATACHKPFRFTNVPVFIGFFLLNIPFIAAMFKYTYFLNMKSFYDGLASDYDTMTDFENRFEREESVFRKIVERYSIQTALDAGAGTGFHSLLLAGLGIHVTAIDISPAMLRQLQHNASRMKLPINTVAANFQNLSDVLDTTFDAVFCLGNSLVHLLTDEDLEKTLSGFYSLLKPGGVLIVQILNYDRIMKERKRVQNIKKKGNTTFIRFYDYCNEKLFFNILKVTDTDDGVEHTLNTVELRPLHKEELTGYLKEAGFSSIEHYGSLQFQAYDDSESPNLVTVARR